MTSGFYLSYFYIRSLANLLLDSGKNALNYSYEAIHDIRFFIFPTFTPGVWQTYSWILANMLSTIATMRFLTSGFLSFLLLHLESGNPASAFWQTCSQL